MLARLDLGGTWRLAFTDWQRFGRPASVEKEEVDEARFIDAQVPGEVHLDAWKAGLIQDPYVGLNSLSARWIEECEWSYRRILEVPAEALTGRAWLNCECLDLNARIVINGVEVGKHANSFVPARIEVTGKLKAGRNVLVVHLESGLYGVSDKAGDPYGHGPDAKLHKRHWLRKPQCQFGWDWSPRLVNVGIQGPIALEWTTDAARLERVVPMATLSSDLHSGTVRVRAFIQGLTDAPVTATLAATLGGVGTVRGAATGSSAIEVKPGLHAYELTLTLANPELWWPINHGAQALYQLTTTLTAGGAALATTTSRVGFRTVRFDQSPLPQGGSRFALEVNNRLIFCKGGNFVPADIIRASIDEARYRGLVDRAIESNFNLLRVWGGGLYEADAFFRLCDERGILVWQEFIFACSRYPGTDEGFWNTIKEEATYHIRRLAEHPSLVAWCGNNEIEQGYWEWNYDKNGAVLPDHAIYHHLLPRLINQEDPAKYYQPSSPYSPNHQSPTAHDVGDQHPWALGFFDIDFRKYREMICRFPNEGGFLGPNSLATIKEALPEGQRHAGSISWQAHDNSIDSWTAPSCTDNMTLQWLGKDIRTMEITELVYWTGLLHGEALREYCDNFRRRMFDSAAAIFWMFNDCWPCSRSWTTIDYRLRYTPAFHPVRRALAPVNIVVSQVGDEVVVFGVNERMESIHGELRYGVFALAGGWPIDKTIPVVLKPNASTRLASFPTAQWTDPKGSMAAAILSANGQLVARNRLFLPFFKDMTWSAAAPTVSLEKGIATFHSATFAWGLALDLDGDAQLADNFFDLYPGVAYRIPWAGAQAPRILGIGNLDAAAPRLTADAAKR